MWRPKRSTSIKSDVENSFYSVLQCPLLPRRSSDKLQVKWVNFVLNIIESCFDVSSGVVTTTDRREVTGVFDDELQLELPPVGSWVIVNVTCVIDPSHFFVVLPFGARSRIENPFEEVKFSSSQHDGNDLDLLLLCQYALTFEFNMAYLHKLMLLRDG